MQANVDTKSDFFCFAGRFLGSDDWSCCWPHPLHLGVLLHCAALRSRRRRQSSGHHQRHPLPTLRMHSVRYRFHCHHCHLTAHQTHWRKACKIWVQLWRWTSFLFSFLKSSVQLFAWLVHMKSALFQGVLCKFSYSCPGWHSGAGSVKMKE